MKKKNKKEDNHMKFLCLFIVIIVFTIAFVLLINKQNKDSYLADINDINFKIEPEKDRIIVARDMHVIYPKYYVAYIDNNYYSLYAYSYYDTVSQYNLEINRLSDSLVDYNIKDKMIRYLVSKGYGTYSEVLNNLAFLTECNELKIY